MTEQVSVRLASDILYVEGYVNGSLAEFQKQENNMWTAIVEKSDNNIYEVYIKAYNTNGLATEVSTTLYYGVNLIYDRTTKDLYDKTDKAYYNTTDLNRVESATEYISRLLKLYSYFYGELECKKDWLMTDFPTEEEMNRYLNNIQKLMDSFYLKENTPNLPQSMNYLDIEKANNIEKILYDLNELIENMISQFYYCGEIYSGEV